MTEFSVFPSVGRLIPITMIREYFTSKVALEAETLLEKYNFNNRPSTEVRLIFFFIIFD